MAIQIRNNRWISDVILRNSNFCYCYSHRSMSKSKLKSKFNTVLVYGLLLATMSSTVTRPAQAQQSPYTGQNGDSRTIFLNPQQPLFLNLSGTNGAPGFDGARPNRDKYNQWNTNDRNYPIDRYRDEYDYDRYGDYNKYSDYDRYGDYDEYNQHYPSKNSFQCDNSDVGKVAKNITMANGESGNNGSNGGNGGNGGDLTIYYQNRLDLRQVLVDSSPGRGGSGGRGSRGTRGCQCPVSSWKVNDKIYTCKPGYRGTRGNNGADGSNGKMGQLRIIASNTAIAGDSPLYAASLSKIASQPIPLTLNRWYKQSGALALLQMNSKISDEYLEYRDRLERTATVKWNAKSVIDDYATQAATVRLQENGEIGFDFKDKELWSMVEQVDTSKDSVMSINAIVHQRDVTKLNPGISDNRDRKFTLAIIDSAAKSDLVETQFSVKIKSGSGNGIPNRSGNTETHYEGVLPTNLVTRDYNRFILNLGALPVPSDTFKTGNDVQVEIKAIRSLGSRSTTQTIDWSGTVY